MFGETSRDVSQSNGMHLRRLETSTKHCMISGNILYICAYITCIGYIIHMHTYVFMNICSQPLEIWEFFGWKSVPIWQHFMHVYMKSVAYLAAFISMHHTMFGETSRDVSGMDLRRLETSRDVLRRLMHGFETSRDVSPNIVWYKMFSIWHNSMQACMKCCQICNILYMYA